MNQQPLTTKIKTINQHLNSCIQIGSAKIDRRTSIPYQVNFCLNKELLAEIEQIRASNSRLELSAGNLANLRHYALHNLPSEFICRHRHRQELMYGDSVLTFATQYSASQNQSSITLVQSEIDLEGKVSQQVQQQLVRDSVLLTQISQAHYWLILEILAQLPLKSEPWHFWFAVGCLSILVAISCSLIWYLSPFHYLLKVIICLGIILLTKLIFKTSIIHQLKTWIVSHLLNGVFSKKLSQKHLGLKMLNLIISFN